MHRVCFTLIHLLLLYFKQIKNGFINTNADELQINTDAQSVYSCVFTVNAHVIPYLYLCIGWQCDLLCELQNRIKQQSKQNQGM